MSIVELKELKNVEALEWGKKNEKKKKKNAVESCMKIAGKRDTNLKLLTCGLYLFKPNPYVGETPDNILKYDCCPKSCIPCKCFYAIRNEKLTKSWQNVIF